MEHALLSSRIHYVIHHNPLVWHNRQNASAYMLQPYCTHTIDPRRLKEYLKQHLYIYCKTNFLLALEACSPALTLSGQVMTDALEELLHYVA